MKLRKDDLQKLGIFQLRAIGRNVGVHLPTKYKKDNLIDKIILIIDGEEQPHVRKNMRGRPAKILDEIDYGNRQPIPDNCKIENDFNYGFEGLCTIPCENNIYDGSTIQIYGVVDMIGAKKALVVPIQNTQEYALVNRELVNEWKLETGDLIHATAMPLDDNRPAIAVTIIDKNGNKSPKESSIPNVFANRPSIINRDYLIRNDNNNMSQLINLLIPFHYGDSVIVSGEKQIDVSLTTYFLLKNLAENKSNEIICVLNGVKKSYKDSFTSIEGIKYFLSEFGDEEEFIVKIADLAIEYAEKIINECSRNVIFVVHDVDKLLEIAKNVDKKFVTKIKKFFTKAKAIENASLSVVYTMLTSGVDYHEFEGNQNLLIKSLSEDDVYKSPIKIDILNTRRNDLLTHDNIALSRSIKSYIKQDPIKNFSEIIELASKVDTDSFMEELKNFINSKK